MADIGEAPDLPIPEGQAELSSMADKGVPAPDILSYKTHVSQTLANGGVPLHGPNSIAAYWGDEKPPAPKTVAAGASNVSGAAAVSPDQGKSILSDPINYLGAALGTAVDGLKAYGSTDYGAAVNRGQAAAGASFSAGLAELNANKPVAQDTGGDASGQVDPFTALGHMGMATYDFSSAAFQEVWAPVGAAINAAANPVAAKVTLPGAPGFKINAGPLGSVQGDPTQSTKLPQDWTGDTVGLVAGFALGGDHSLPPAVIPEATRYTAMEATHAGELKVGPAGIVDHHLNPTVASTPPVAGIRDAIPTYNDFGTQAAKLVNNAVDVKSLKAVSHNLQQVWVNTGIHPADAVAMAEKDPVYRDELFHQTISGETVAPHFQAFKPPQPEPYVKPGATPAEGAMSDEDLMRSLEGSGANALGPVTHANGGVRAEGTFQIEPYTARQYMGADFDMSTLRDPAVNKHVADIILADLHRRYNGNQEAMAIGYNAGPGRADKWVANTEGAGTRLEAVRDNNLRSGWRYTTVATARDERWLPLETQQYVARARYKLGGGKEPEGVVHDGGPHVTTPDGTTPVQGGLPGEREPYEFEAPETEEPTEEPVIDRVDVHTGKSVFVGEASGGAATAWGLDRPYGDAEDEILSNIGEQKDLPSPKGLGAYDRFVGAVMDRNQPAKALSDDLLKRGDLDPDDYNLYDAYGQVTKSPYRAQIAAGATEHGGGAIDWDPEKKEWTVDKDVPTARTAIASALKNGGSTQGLMAWLLARRTMVLEVNRKINSGFNVGAASRMMADDDARAMYQDAADQWDAYNHGVMKYAVKSGWKSQAEADAIEGAGAWVSMRALRGDETSFKLPDKGFVIGNPLKRMRGKNGQIVDPLVASLDNNMQIFRAADINLATHELVSHAEANPEFAATFGLQKVGGAKLPDLDDIDNELKKYGFDPDDEETMDKARQAFGSIIGERQDALMGKQQFAYYRDGVKEIWSTSSPELANMIKGSSAIQANMITRIAKDISALVRVGIEAPVDFAIRAGAGHQFVQWINNKLHPPPMYTGLNGLLKNMGMHDLFLEAAANGAMGTSLIDMDKDSLYDTMGKILTDNGTLDHVPNDVGQYKAKTLAWNRGEGDSPSILSHATDLLEKGGDLAINGRLSPVRLSRAVQERLDQGNRTGLYTQGRAAGYSKAKAGANAAYAGIDYTNGGSNSIISAWSQMVPFMRPSLLYTKNALDAIERNPAAYITMATVAVTIPKVALFALNMYADSIPKGQPGYVPDADKYANLPNWEKLYYYITPPIDGQRIKMRMPAFAGFTFGAVPEAIMQGVYEHDPVQFMDLFQSWMRDTFPPMIPPLLQAPTELATGHNLDTFQPLVPSSLANAYAELEQTPSSSVAAKAVSRLVSPPLRAMGVPMKLSPIVIDHVTGGWLGETGSAIDQAVNAATDRPGPPTDIATIPFVHGFLLSHPGLNGQVLDDYYKEKAVFDSQAANKAAIKKERIQEDDPNADGSMVPDAIRYSEADKRLDAISKTEARMRLQLWAINDNPHMSDDEKLTQGTNITNIALQLAHNATLQMRQFEHDHPVKN